MIAGETYLEEPEAQFDLFVDVRDERHSDDEAAIHDSRLADSPAPVAVDAYRGATE